MRHLCIPTQSSVAKRKATTNSTVTRDEYKNEEHAHHSSSNDSLMGIRIFSVQYSQGPWNYTILQLNNLYTTHIKVGDLRDLLSHGEPLFHELLIVSLEIICHQFKVKYLKPAFFSILREQGWYAVGPWFRTTTSVFSNKPNMSDDIINIPIHVHNNHWVGSHHCTTGNRVHFFYADDLNNRNIEEKIWHIVFQYTWTIFCPPDST